MKKGKVKIKATTRPKQKIITDLTIKQQQPAPAATPQPVDYSFAMSRIYPQDTIRILVPKISSHPSVVPRETISESFAKYQVIESGDQAKSVSFGLCFNHPDSGWIFVETMPAPATMPHAVIKECDGKKCVACPAPATHKIVEVVESGAPKNAFLCCYHFCWVVFGNASGQHE